MLCSSHRHHPALEMQDTFYLEHPDHIEVPAERLEQWRDVHVDGGATESRGWGGPFSEEISQRPLLRTHTTVNTIQYLAEHPSNPCRVFSVDRVFRKESIDRTHLPEFHQIEGIIMEEDANLPMLVTTLRTFYTKMGCPDVRVRPAYFPYTELSLEVEVKWRGAWLELGGAGIFRPEVTEPLGRMGPVCAWGMGLERLAMLVLGLDGIRQLYLSDLEVLSMTSRPLNELEDAHVRSGSESIHLPLVDVDHGDHRRSPVVHVLARGPARGSVHRPVARAPATLTAEAFTRDPTR